MPRLKLKAKGLIEVEALESPLAFFWWWLANDGDAELCAAAWQKSVRTWSPTAVEAYVGGDEGRRAFMAKWRRLFSPQTAAGLKRAADAERAAARAWLMERTGAAPQRARNARAKA